MSFIVRLENKVERVLEKMPDEYRAAVITRIAQLAVDPYFQTRKVRGDRHEGYRVRTGDYRILYQINTQARTVLVYDILWRDKAYKKR